MMTPRTQTQTETKSRQKIAADNMTPVQKLTRALQSGPLKSELRTTPEVMHFARAFCAQITAAGMKYGEDFAVHVAYLTPDLTMLFTRKFEPGQEAAIQTELSDKCCIWAGLIFGIRDPENDGLWLLGARTFLNTPLVTSALRQRVEAGFEVN